MTFTFDLPSRVGSKFFSLLNRTFTAASEPKTNTIAATTMNINNMIGSTTTTKNESNAKRITQLGCDAIH